MLAVILADEPFIFNQKFDISFILQKKLPIKLFSSL